MFEKKTCPSCGKKIKEEWKFCPHCGAEVEERSEREITPFRSIFADIDKEFERIDKLFSFSPFKIPTFKMKPGLKGGGISITVQSGTGMKPKVEVKTFGEYKKLEPEIKRKLGVRPPIEEVKEKPERKKIKVPKVTEEPETRIQTLKNKQIIYIKLPEVKSEDDIEVKQLEQSVEVKAFTDDKAYFKLIPIPPNATISKEFKGNVLKLEIEK